MGKPTPSSSSQSALLSGGGLFGGETPSPKTSGSQKSGASQPTPQRRSTPAQARRRNDPIPPRPLSPMELSEDELLPFQQQEGGDSKRPATISELNAMESRLRRVITHRGLSDDEPEDEPATRTPVRRRRKPTKKVQLPDSIGSAADELGLRNKTKVLTVGPTLLLYGRLMNASTQKIAMTVVYACTRTTSEASFQNYITVPLEEVLDYDNHKNEGAQGPCLPHIRLDMMDINSSWNIMAINLMIQHLRQHPDQYTDIQAKEIAKVTVVDWAKIFKAKISRCIAEWRNSKRRVTEDGEVETDAQAQARNAARQEVRAASLRRASRTKSVSSSLFMHHSPDARCRNSYPELTPL